jgi:antitoxin component HigA of HigAB toxin-antitoxin module
MKGDKAATQNMRISNPSRSEREAIELLTLLIERYEETHYPISPAGAVSVVRLLLEQQDLTQRSNLLLTLLSKADSQT